MYDNNRILRRPPEGCRSTPPGSDNPELGLRGLGAKVSSPPQSKEEEQAREGERCGQQGRVVCAEDSLL